jgi:outer membrane protein TolC
VKALLLAAAVTASAQTTPAPVRSLSDAYRLARANIESVAASEQTLRQAEALYRRALGLSLPELSARAQTDIRDPQNQAFTDVFLRIAQTGFGGYREFAAIKAGKADAARRAAELRRAEQLLLADVAAAFFGHLQAAQDEISTRELQDLAGKRLVEMRERVRIGRTREADAIAQEFQAAGLSAQLEETGRLAAARADVLKFLTKAPSVEPAPLGDSFAEAKPLEEHLGRVERRPDVEAARHAADSALAGLRLTRADRLPSVNYGFNYFLSRPQGLSRNFRTSGDWEASLTAILPLWSWGGRDAASDAAKAGLTAQELALAQTRRVAELEVRNAWRDHDVARRQLGIRRKALELASRDYQLQRRDEGRGLVTSLEVLESLNRLNGARLEHNRALLNARLTAVALELSSGAVPTEIDLR